jgi:hypothetical protein
MSKVSHALRAPQIASVILGAIIVKIAVVVGIGLLMRAIGLRTSSTSMAFLLGAVIASALLLLTGVVAVAAGGVNWLTGAWAERWTGEKLALLGSDWRVVHNLVFRRESGGRTWEFDIDHIAVGPGGVLVVESKYSTSEVDLEASYLSSRIRSDAEQASRNARSVRQLLAAADIKIQVTPVLVYWGFRLTLPQEPIREIGRVQVVLGADAKRWCRRLCVDKVEQRDAERAWTALASHSEAHAAATPPTAAGPPVDW